MQKTHKEKSLFFTEAMMRKISVASLGMFALIASSLGAQSQELHTPAAITPPSGNVLFLKAHAKGTQNYICEPSSNGDDNTWVFFSPQATLTVPVFGRFDQQVVTHFLSPVPHAGDTTPASCTSSTETGETSCPTWQSSMDSSAIWGGKIGSINAGTDTSCPNDGAIPCLLLNAVATTSAQNKFGILAKTTFVQRLNTEGGAAPTASCKVGDQALVPYSADYYFYKAEHEDSLGH